MKLELRTWRQVTTCWTLAALLMLPARAGAAPSPEDELSELPSVEDEPADDALPDVEGPDLPPPPSEEQAPTPSPSAEVGAAPIEDSGASPVPPPPSMQQPTVVRVAVGLSPELDGNKAEIELLDQLESAVSSSPDPRADVRRLRVGAAQPRELCREGRDDLIINIGHVPDRDEPVLLTHDCRISEALGIRVTEAAGDPDLLGVLWAEHNQRVAEGARERRRARISPKARTGIIAGAAVLVIGAALSLLIVGAVQQEKVVLVVSPNP